MLITLVDVVSCENPHCREFAKLVPEASGARSYYCQVCGQISYPRTVDAGLATQPQAYKEHLRRVLSPAKLANATE
ncbi:MAG: hypothetical protein ABFD54_17900 [Armatimonadota bacterium]|nr:hypothetical protein [bacterium]